MRHLAALIVALCLVGAYVAQPPIDANHIVVRFHVDSMKVAAALIEHFIPTHSVDGVSLWTSSVQVPGDIDIHLPRHLLSVMIDTLKAHGHTGEHKVISTNLLERIEQHLRENEQARATNDGFFSAYRTFEEINSYIHELHNRYPNFTHIELIGHTVHGAKIEGIVIESPHVPQARPWIVYTGGQHAREWMGPMTVTYIADQLLSQYGKDPAITHIVDNVVWALFPVMNVDGYQWSWTNSSNRLWRKNRRVNEHSLFGCIGVDLNRNWNTTGWGVIGTSNNTCSDQYNGPYPFSEPESSAIANFIHKNNRIQGFIDYHQYGQLFMAPFGYQATPLPVGNELLQELGKGYTEALFKVHGTQYKYGNLNTIIYPSSGDSGDWVFDTGRVFYSYGVELRDTGEYGVLQPPDRIIPNCDETVAGVKFMANFILENPKPQQ